MTRRKLRLSAACLIIALAPFITTCALTSSSTSTVYGYVRDAQTQALVAGAIVECESEWMTTGTDGFYQLEGISEGWRSVHAEASGYGDYSDAVDISGDTRYDIPMDVAVGVSHVYGVVVRPGQGPIEGALVDIDGRTRTTDADGEYEYWNVPRNAETMTVTLDGYRSYTTPLYLNEDEEEVDVTLLLLASVTFEATSDATVRFDIPGTNLGWTTTLDLFNNPSWHFRFLIHFDVSALPATAVAEACTLRLTNTWEGSGEETVPTVVARAATAWEELEVTWANAPQFTGPTYATASFEPPVYDIDVTGHVNDWLSGYASNYGLIVDTDEDPTATRFSFASREHEEEAWRPRLVLHYAW